MKTFMQSAAQVLFFIVVTLMMNSLANSLDLPVPGSILGVFLIFFLLQFKVIQLEWVDLGAKWLLAEMLLFFIPSAAGLIQYQSLLFSSGFKILLVLVCSTSIVMICAGITAQQIVKQKERKAS
jgi:holin-like protein